MLRVKDWMSSPVHSLQENESLHAARDLMDLHRIRHIPIVDMDNNFIGLITHRDLLSATISELAELDSETRKEIDSGIPLREIMNTDVRTVEPDSNLKDAAQLLLNHKYGCLPVLDNDQLVGILTEADFLKLTITLIEALNEEQ